MSLKLWSGAQFTRDLHAYSEGLSLPLGATQASRAMGNQRAQGPHATRWVDPRLAGTEQARHYEQGHLSLVLCQGQVSGQMRPG